VYNMNFKMYFNCIFKCFVLYFANIF